MSHWPARTCLVHESGRQQCTHQHHLEQCCLVESKQCAQFVFYLLNNLSSTYITRSISQSKYVSKKVFRNISKKVTALLMGVLSPLKIGLVLYDHWFGLVWFWFRWLSSVPLITRLPPTEQPVGRSYPVPFSAVFNLPSNCGQISTQLATATILQNAQQA